MRLIARIGDDSQEVIGEAFSIEGSDEKFAVHPAVGLDRGEFAATHLGTGLRIALADKPDEAIALGRAAWRSRTPAQIAERIARAKTDPWGVVVTEKDRKEIT